MLDVKLGRYLKDLRFKKEKETVKKAVAADLKDNFVTLKKQKGNKNEKTTVLWALSVPTAFAAANELNRET